MFDPRRLSANEFFAELDHRRTLANLNSSALNTGPSAGNNNNNSINNDNNSILEHSSDTLLGRFY